MTILFSIFDIHNRGMEILEIARPELRFSSKTARNEELLFSTFQKYILLLCYDVCEKRYIGLKLRDNLNLFAPKMSTNQGFAIQLHIGTPMWR